MNKGNKIQKETKKIFRMAMALLAAISTIQISSGSSFLTDVYAAQIVDHGETGHTDGGNVGVPGYPVHLKTYNGNYAYCIEPERIVSQQDVYSVSHDISGISEKQRFVAWYCDGKGGDYYAAGQHLIWEGTGAYVNGVSSEVNKINAAWDKYKKNNNFNLTVSGDGTSSSGNEINVKAYIGSVIKITDSNSVMSDASISSLPSFLSLCDASGNEISGAPSGNTFYVKVNTTGSGTITVSRYTNNNSRPVILYSPSDQSLIVAGGISPKVGKINIEALPINIAIVKKSTVPNISANNKCYSLEGAKYGVYTDEKCTKKIGEIKTDKNGKGTLKDITVNRTYSLFVKEIEPSKGFLIDSQVYNISLTGKQTEIVNSSEYPRNDPAGITLTKIDEESAVSIAPLSDAEFTIKYYDGQYNSSNLPVSPTRTWVIKTIEKNGKYYTSIGLGNTVKVSGDDFYKTESGIITLPLGTITVQETKAPIGYTLEGAYLNAGSQELPKTDDGAVILNITNDDSSDSGATLKGGNDYTKEDKAIYGSVKFSKRDYETKQASALGNATLENTVVELLNDGDTLVRFEGKEYKKGEIVTTVTTDKNGFYQFPDKSLTYGDYILREKTAPNGYLHEGYLEKEFKIRTDGEVVDMTSPENSIQNKVKRGDMEFRKIKSDGQNAMGNIEFEISSMTTGETHKIMTDENGYYSSESSWNKHSNDTNSGKSDSGLWFGAYKKDGSDEYTEMTEPNDSLGALPYDTYQIKEIRGKNNENMTMFSDIFTISRDKHTISLNNIENEEIAMRTNAHNNIDGKNIIPATGEAVIVDEVSYEGVQRNKTYSLVTYLADQETGELLKDASGQIITAEKTFTPTMKKDTVSVELHFDASNLQGVKAVIFEYLYEGEGDSKDGPVVRHNDLEDADQLVVFPEIHTNANGKDTSEHISSSGDVTIVDTVSYKNLIKGNKYYITGTLMNKETGKPHLDDDGNEITAKADFTAADSEGTVNVTFTFKGINTSGTAVIAFENLYYQDILFAVHADIEDKDQTVYFPKIRTMAQSETGKKNVMSGETSKIIDTVNYEWTCPDKTYKLVTKLYDITENKLLDVVEEHDVKSIEKDGEWPVEIIFDSTNLIEHDIVVFEYLYFNGVEIAKHEDKTDVDQTVTIEGPQLEKYVNKDVHKDLARFHETFTYDVLAYVTSDADKVTITDTLVDELEFVSSKDNVQIQVMDGKNDHKVHGTVQTDGAALKDADKTIDGQKLTVFIENAEPYRGKWIKVTFDAKIKSEYVAAAQLSHENISDNIRVLEGVTPHEGIPNKAEYVITIDDNGKYELESNTVTITPPTPEIKTIAADGKDGDHNVLLEGKTTIIDTVSFKNLEEGQKYVLVGTLVNKKSGFEASVNGKIIKAETEFIPSDINGTIDVVFQFDGSALHTDTFVVFEKLYAVVENPAEKRIEITNHEDITDEEQTINAQNILYVSVLKVDASDSSKVLKDAEFTVYNKKTNQIAKDIKDQELVVKTNGNGIAYFTLADTEDGYYVKETKAPHGYRLNRLKYDIKPVNNKGYSEENPIVITVDDKKNTSPNTADLFDDNLFVIFGSSTFISLLALMLLIRDKAKRAE